MLDLIVKGTEAVIRQIEKDAKNARYAGRNALNQSAKIAAKDGKAAMLRVFDRPTPFIVNSLRVAEYAKPEKLSVRVGFKDVFAKDGFDPVADTLLPHITGKPRRPKPSEKMLRRAGILGGDEYLMPSRTAPFNRYGNITKGVMGKILADLNAHTASGYTSNRKGNKKRQYIIGKVGNTRGIFKVMGGYDKAGTGGWKLIFLIVKGAPSYRKRFDFYGLMEKSIDKSIGVEYDKAWREVAR